jgi:hypothetical protein
MNNTRTHVNARIPIGSFIALMPGMNVADDLVIPYGQWLKEEEYPDLFKVIGKQNGYNEEKKEFRLPMLVEFKDLRNIVRITCGEQPIVKHTTYFMKIK